MVEILSTFLWLYERIAATKNWMEEKEQGGFNKFDNEKNTSTQR